MADEARRVPKLVRDRVPEIIAASSESYRCHVADADEYRTLLARKLVEEAHEVVTAFLAAPSAAVDSPDLLDELADLMEVATAVMQLHGISWNQVTLARNIKRGERGAFSGRIVLDEW